MLDENSQLTFTQSKTMLCCSKIQPCRKVPIWTSRENAVPMSWVMPAHRSGQIWVYSNYCVSRVTVVWIAKRLREGVFGYFQISHSLSFCCPKKFWLRSTSDFLSQFPQRQLLFQQYMHDLIRHKVPTNKSGLTPLSFYMCNVYKNFLSTLINNIKMVTVAVWCP